MITKTAKSLLTRVLFIALTICLAGTCFPKANPIFPLPALAQGGENEPIPAPTDIAEGREMPEGPPVLPSGINNVWAWNPREERPVNPATCDLLGPFYSYIHWFTTESEYCEYSGGDYVQGNRWGDPADWYLWSNDIMIVDKYDQQCECNQEAACFLSEDSFPYQGNIAVYYNFDDSDHDWFRVNLEEGPYKFKVVPPSNVNIAIELFPWPVYEGDYPIAWSLGEGTGQPEEFVFAIEDSGPYAIWIFSQGGANNNNPYELTVEKLNATFILSGWDPATGSAYTSAVKAQFYNYLGELVHTAWTSNLGPIEVELPSNLYWVEASNTQREYVRPERTGFIAPAGGTQVEIDFVISDESISAPSIEDQDEDEEELIFLPLIVKSEKLQEHCFSFAGGQCKTFGEWLEWYTDNKEVEHQVLISEAGEELPESLSSFSLESEKEKYAVEATSLPLMFLPTVLLESFYQTWEALDSPYFQRTHIAINQITGIVPYKMGTEYRVAINLQVLYLFPWDEMEFYYWRVNYSWIILRVETNLQQVAVLTAVEAATLLRELQDQYGEEGLEPTLLSLTEEEAQFLVYVRDAGILMIVIFTGTTVMVLTISTIVPVIPPPP